MRATLFLAPLLALSACGSSGSATFDQMAGSKWANTLEACASQFTTFEDRTIRMRYPDGSMDFGKIVIIGDAPPRDTMLTVEPSEAIKNAAEKRSAKRLPDAVTMGFQLNGDHLHLRAMVGGDNGEIGGEVLPESIEGRLFNLVRCPR
ncbi:hypothetical protein [Sphingomonas paucimobilis]|uniref:hypothetical protein n=1 Tax=Sphingomonas paucimobilis TaxID=13689 RepID=UPI0028D1AFAC|nr:hypothetical protein [Sphingomonas paucimobilis]